ncbi:hypothetical protein [Acaryochloris sp. IP29b_bin.148]|uniref:hypothetical protein n=1 Tax=Acaryochloris sp. IP29b_bin.148 TaxID=2969218 RepID=UPI00261AD3A6|nr:hypothetical protein [Acaryochloris sp. IP29b_bin.148]
MKNIRTRDQYDAVAQKLVGLEIQRVTYFEIEYGTDEPCYLHQPEIGHFLDYGLEFKTRDDGFRTFFWDGTFYQYGIGIFPHEAKCEVTTSRQWDVSATSDWRPFIGSMITSVDVFWSWASESVTDDEAFRTYYPQDLRLSFSCHRHIYLSASQYMDLSDRLWAMSDDILVVFDETVAQKYAIGPYALGT